MTSSRGTKSHTADLGLWLEADGEAELYESAAAALGELMYRGPREGEIAWLPLELSGQDRADLLVGLLGEVVYLADGEGLLTVACRVREATAVGLSARLGVIPLLPGAHSVNQPVKAVTFHNAVMAETAPGRWRGEVVLDV